MRMRPLAADDPMTLWSAAVGDTAAAMKGGLSLSNRGEAGCGRARGFSGREKQPSLPLQRALQLRSCPPSGEQHSADGLKVHNSLKALWNRSTR